MGHSGSAVHDLLALAVRSTGIMRLIAPLLSVGRWRSSSPGVTYVHSGAAPANGDSQRQRLGNTIPAMPETTPMEKAGWQ